jgi:hypothetical protein
MPSFLQIYAEEDKNIKEIKRKKNLKLIGPEKYSCSCSVSN